MTRIDFYSNAEPKLQVACQLVARIVQQGLRVFVYAPDENTARTFDELLRTYQPVGFILGFTARHALSSETPVVIACGDVEMVHRQVMVNLHADSPPSFSRFERLVELVGLGDDDRQLARSRFRFYRDRGYEINHYDLSKASI
ncbi:MAG: DNA polymerase III subunit chi [Betaproteobacteria bacterium]|jgi:DNA polymerase-3 subunit chi|nr:MAG: DNA polymerase III subunit chi [Betaproteobacteria bacterium]TMH79306.1 MAG: DNA polymerase III subunit chi [Betaproteobacteria bacterium]